MHLRPEGFCLGAHVLGIHMSPPLRGFSDSVLPGNSRVRVSLPVLLFSLPSFHFLLPLLSFTNIVAACLLLLPALRLTAVAGCPSCC